MSLVLNSRALVIESLKLGQYHFENINMDLIISNLDKKGNHYLPELFLIVKVDRRVTWAVLIIYAH